MHVLFVCSQNRLRSPTAEALFSGYDGVETASAGLNHDAARSVTAEMLAWADVVFVMEKSHLNQLNKRFRALLREKRVLVLGIPDEFDYMEPALIEILEAKVGSYLRRLP
jgi:predicted protein tyrosine phosphatase